MNLVLKFEEKKIDELDAPFEKISQKDQNVFRICPGWHMIAGIFP